METKKVQAMSEREHKLFGEMRSKSEADWIDNHASGTLRKSKKLNFSYRKLYLQERVAYEFGYGFSITPRSNISFGDALIEGDCHELTEACWHSERLLSFNRFPDTDFYEVKYMNVTLPEDVEEGIGLIVRQTSAVWVPDGHIVYAIITKFDKVQNKWCKAENPL